MHPGHNKPIWISNFERGTGRAFRRVPFSYRAPPTLFCIKRKRIFNFRSKTLSRLTWLLLADEWNVWRVLPPALWSSHKFVEEILCEDVSRFMRCKLLHSFPFLFFFFSSLFSARWIFLYISFVIEKCVAEWTREIF